MKFVELVYINGATERNTKDNGLTIKCMVKANFGGQMEKSTMEIS